MQASTPGLVDRPIGHTLDDGSAHNLCSVRDIVDSPVVEPAHRRRRPRPPTAKWPAEETEAPAKQHDSRQAARIWRRLGGFVLPGAGDADCEDAPTER
ncbi:hypothetical protein GCM10023221_00650 [Luteimicrobium xylanilyticum]|uniref:Uncharacterized protein n=1 Tax=Luteimicrobium xylanilyticum TaxID=1133546 RepID=A0A5P9Q867_9MICO|nr:hypothetical protein KDY119_01137 [Luteimicrobium xylanilyticum]